MNPIIHIIRWAQVRANAPRIAANPNPYGVCIRADLPYRDDGNPDHTLDVYSPAPDAPRLPVIVELHGGGYLSCSKEINAQHGQYLASRGFHVVNMNYTLCPEGDLIHATGKSADFFRVRKPAVTVKSYAASCPQGSFAWRHLPRNLPATLGFLILHKFTLDREYARHSAYDYFMDAGYPRVWFCATPTDKLLYSQIRRMHEYMVAHNIPHEYREYTSHARRLEHVFNILRPDYPESRAANDDMLSFFKNTAG